MAYTWPIDITKYTTTQDFGAFPNNGVNPAGGHTGRDFAMPVGAPIYAIANGTVKYAGNAQNIPGGVNNTWWIAPGFAGNVAVIDHGGLVSISAHLLRFAPGVTNGAAVKQGQLVGYADTTGLATGSHLHFEVMPDGWNFYNGTYGRVNPALYCKGSPIGQATVLAANQRKVGPQGGSQRALPNNDPGTKIIRQIPGGTVETFTSFVRGEKLTINGLTTDVWFKDAAGYAWAGIFESQSTAGLPDATPKNPTPAANQRKVGAGADVLQRNLPYVEGTKVVREIPAGQMEVFTHYVRAESVTWNGLTSDLWYKDSVGYVWAGGFETQVTTGLLLAPTPPKPVVDPPAPPVDPKPPVDLGPILDAIDLSKWQPGNVPSLVDCDVVWVGTSVGMRLVNAPWMEQIDAAKKAGRAVGLYHIRNWDDALPEEEAVKFVGTVRGYIDGKTPLILDWEECDMSQTDWALAWLQSVERQTGVKPMIYLGANIESQYDWSKVVANGNKLVIASYPYSTNIAGFQHWDNPPKPKWWPKATMWQYSGKGRLPGFANDLDLSAFYGTLTDWYALGKIATPPVVEPDPDTPVEPEPLPTSDTQLLLDIYQRLSERFGSEPTK